MGNIPKVLYYYLSSVASMLQHTLLPTGSTYNHDQSYVNAYPHTIIQHIPAST